MPDNFWIVIIAFAIIVIIALRWLFSWWLRTNEMIDHLKAMRESMAAQEEHQRATRYELARLAQRLANPPPSYPAHASPQEANATSRQAHD